MLSTSTGAKFDQHYAADIGVDAHQDTVALFEKAARDATDPDVKAFAAKTLPTLKQHLEMARSMKSAADAALKSGGTTASR